MSADRRAAVDTLVTAVEIARLAKVTRAAVSNWRRRYPDFPAPAGGTDRNPLFALSEVDAWLARHDKGNELSPEVLIWQALRGEYGDDVIRGLADVSDLLITGSSDALDPALRSLVLDLARQSTPAEVVEGLTERFLGSAGRAGSEQISTPQLVRAVRHFAGPVTGTVFDPACGDRLPAPRVPGQPRGCAGRPGDQSVRRAARVGARATGGYRRTSRSRWATRYGTISGRSFVLHSWCATPRST